MTQYFGSNLILLDRLATGGMGEVFRARQVGTGGFEKIVAVKRILSHFAERADFAEMFRREMNLCAKLQHPNIVQVYSNGEEQGYFFLVMEFVNGKNLAEVLSTARASKQRIPPQVSCYIAAEVAKALQYAHTRVDDTTGKPLGIVHRDISPQNIMLTYDGEVKVVDFGIAKAADRGDVTKLGDLKGKVPYVSPEHIDGKELDARADVFSLGVVFYELLSQRTLFAGKSTFDTLRNVRESDIPSLTDRFGDVPRELEAVSLKALVREREQRYQSAEDFYRALSQYSHKSFPGFIGSDCAKFMQEVFKDRIREEQADRRWLDQRLSNRGGTETIMVGINPILAGQNDAPVDWWVKWRVLLIVGLIVLNLLLVALALVQRRNAGAIEPGRVPGMLAKFEADSLQGTAGMRIVSWKSSGPYPIMAQQLVIERQPVLVTRIAGGHSAVSFDGIDDYLNIDGLAERLLNAQGATLFFVSRSRADRKQIVFSLQAGDFLQDVLKVGFDVGRRLRVRTSSDPTESNGSDSSPVAISDFGVFSAVFEQGQILAYLNGKIILQAALRAAPIYALSNSSSIGQEYDGPNLPSDFLRGELCELIIFGTTLDSNSRVAIEKYLRLKYDL